MNPSPAPEAPEEDHPICKTCGSDDLELDVIAAWNRATGKAEVTSIMDQGHYCRVCDRERDIEWVPT